MLVFVDGDRKTIRLGAIPRKQAEAMLRHIEALAASLLDHSAPPEATARWLAELDEKIRERIVRASLAQPRHKPRGVTVGELIDHYKRLKYQSDGAGGYAQGTINVHEAAFASMLGHWPADTVVADISGGDCDDFVDWMSQKGLAEATIRKRSAIAKKLLGYAVKKRWLDRNPYEDSGVKTASVGNSARQVFIPPADALKVLQELPDTQWRLLFVLSRFGGLRVGSEPRQLKIGHVNAAAGTLTVPSPKTKRYQGKAERIIPLWPELERLITKRFHEMEEGEEMLLPFLRGRTDASLRKPMFAAIQRAGLQPWPRLWHNLRSSRQTELLGPHYRCNMVEVCAWLGNSEAVANRHYVQATADGFSRAAQIAALPETAWGDSEPEAVEGQGAKRPVIVAPALSGGSSQKKTIAEAGLEPARGLPPTGF
ncbi:tyrosine-type recombinase/integrase [Pseudobythopirellula maris]|uniref:tyrosine-type recombinase/integrase n=1 Tax=Pseudobythopirellula maris TaxID=2527991 RepID=UPI0011B61F05|nr:phage integrase SAM-like domain-containing protein [Pseudobythopirellula maris]